MKCLGLGEIWIWDTNFCVFVSFQNLSELYANYVIGTFGEFLSTCRCEPYLTLKSIHESFLAHAVLLAQIEEYPDLDLADTESLSDGEGIINELWVVWCTYLLIRYIVGIGKANAL